MIHAQIGYSKFKWRPIHCSLSYVDHNIAFIQKCCNDTIIQWNSLLFTCVEQIRERFFMNDNSVVMSTFYKTSLQQTRHEATSLSASPRDLTHNLCCKICSHYRHIFVVGAFFRGESSGSRQLSYQQNLRETAYKEGCNGMPFVLTSNAVKR